LAKDNLLGKWTSTALVVGNMIGAGVFMMPALLAAYGGISILGWVLSTAGALALAFLFKRFTHFFPGVKGGPYGFVREGMGDFSGFLVAWSYWISVWVTVAALAAALISYLSFIFPQISSSPIYSIGFSIGFIWLLTFYNFLGSGRVGVLAVITTVLKILPLILVGVCGLFFIDMDNFEPFNRAETSPWKVIIITTTLTFFSFLGIESATVPGSDVENPEKTVSFATLWGTIIASVIYIISSMSVLGLIPGEQLVVSQAPFSAAAEFMWGPGTGIAITIGAIISVFGALNGWILIQGQMALALAKDDRFPKSIKKLNKYGSPANGLILSSILASILMIMRYSGGLLDVFEFMILVSTVLVLFPYILCAISFYYTKKKNKSPISGLGFMLIFITILFCIVALAGSGWDAFIWGSVFLLTGVPAYFIFKRINA
jgi:APA family basic amino acid/polyamine antiporter